MDITQSFQSKYLQKTDIPTPRRVIIDTVAMENVAQDNQPAEMKPVIFFRGAPKGMVLNRTNANTCMALYGAQTEEWSGKEIEIFNDPTIQFQGQLVGGLRLRPIVPAAEPAPGFDPATGEGSDSIYW